MSLPWKLAAVGRITLIITCVGILANSIMSKYTFFCGCAKKDADSMYLGLPRLTYLLLPTDPSPGAVPEAPALAHHYGSWRYPPGNGSRDVASAASGSLSLFNEKWLQRLQTAIRFFSDEPICLIIFLWFNIMILIYMLKPSPFFCLDPQPSTCQKYCPIRPENRRVNRSSHNCLACFWCQKYLLVDLMIVKHLPHIHTYMYNIYIYTTTFPPGM